MSLALINQAYPAQFEERSGITIRPKIVCKDGFTMSVQASSFHYCLPRSNNVEYTHVEVGFPSEQVDAFMEYAEDERDPTGTVYACVPVELVAQAIIDHGGVASLS